MTCIVGYLEPPKVWIGGDSAGTASDSEQVICANEKVFRCGDFLYGFTSSFRMGQLLRFKLKPPKHDVGVPVFDYLVTRFVDTLRDVLKKGGYATKENNVESGGTFLMGYSGRLFRVESNFQIIESRLPYDAVGCGGAAARGAIHALHKHTAMSARQKIHAALSAAAVFDAAVAPPFRILSLATKEGK